MTIYNSSKFSGPCWTRSRGYHTPSPLPLHIQRIIARPEPVSKETAEKVAREKGYPIAASVKSDQSR